MKAKRLRSEDDSSQGTSKQKSVSREQDASKGDSERLIFQLYEGEELNVRLLTEAERAEIQPGKRGFKRLGYQRKGTMTPSMVETVKRINLVYAKTALEFYEQNQGDEFEIEQVLDCNCAKVLHPSYKILKLWLHVSFTAKSKSDGSTKHFFGELYKNDASGKTHAAYCATFEPSNEPGFEHGCVFCPPGLKNHPADGYLVGCPPWFVPKRKLCMGFM